VYFTLSSSAGERGKSETSFPDPYSSFKKKRKQKQSGGKIFGCFARKKRVASQTPCHLLPPREGKDGRVGERGNRGKKRDEPCPQPCGPSKRRKEARDERLILSEKKGKSEPGGKRGGPSVRKKKRRP